MALLRNEREQKLCEGPCQARRVLCRESAQILAVNLNSCNALTTAWRVLASAGKLCDALKRGAEGPAFIHIEAMLTRGDVRAVRAPLTSIVTLSGCSHDSADGGCSMPAWPALLMTLRSRVRDLLCWRPLWLALQGRAPALHPCTVECAVPWVLGV